MSVAAPLFVAFGLGVAFWLAGRANRSSRGFRHLAGFGGGLCLWSGTVLVMLTMSLLFDPTEACAADICGTWGPIGLLVLLLGWPTALIGALIGLPRSEVG